MTDGKEHSRGRPPPQRSPCWGPTLGLGALLRGRPCGHDCLLLEPLGKDLFSQDLAEGLLGAGGTRQGDHTVGALLGTRGPEAWEHGDTPGPPTPSRLC